MSDWIVAGAAQQLGRWHIGAVVVGAVLALGGYFGISWLANHVSITVQ